MQEWLKQGMGKLTSHFRNKMQLRVCSVDAQRPNSRASTPLPRESELAHSICTPQQVQPRTTSAPLAPKLEDAGKMERDGWRGGGDGFSSGMRKL